MSETDFFQEIEHTALPWRQWQLSVPVFYEDFRFMSVSMLAPAEKIRAILPSPRLRPYRLTPWHGIVTITTYQYRSCDLGPYNEVSLGIPVTIDRDTPLFTGILRATPDVPQVYTHRLPVTIEIAREVGVEFAGYPKFLADIRFSEQGDWLTCKMEADAQHILSLKGRRLPLESVARVRINPITHRQGYILRSEFVISERGMGTSKRGGDISLELGEHEMAEEIRALDPGRVLSYQYCPQAQGSLTPVFESPAG